MPINRRALLSSGIIAASVSAAAAAGPRKGTEPAERRAAHRVFAADATEDQTSALQAAIDEAARSGTTLTLPAGRFRVGPLELKDGVRLVGSGPRTVLEYTGAGGTFIRARGASSLHLADLTVDGNGLALDARMATGLVDLQDCRGVVLERISVRRGLLNGIALAHSSGRIVNSEISALSGAGLFSLDASGLEVAHNSIFDCGNNGIQVWRSKAGEDGTIVVSNRIERIAAKAGGSGENGNGVNVFRAGSVLVAQNRIIDCAYSAVRGNAASNIQILGNSCARLGEVALYAEFGFEGALIANNVVETAGSGIAVTNFNEGGRLAVVQGNIVRNLVRREHEPVDKRGDGISVEADAVVSGNVVEDAPSHGIIAGWGPYLRNVVITGNLVRGAGIGIAASRSEGAGTALISQNMIAGAKHGSIVAMDHEKPVSGDLAREPSPFPTLVVAGNVVT